MKSPQPTRSHEDWTWVAALVGSRARTVGSRRLSGGIVSSVHRLSILDAHGLRHRLVVRRYMGADQRAWGASAVRREAAVLSALERSGLPAPRLVDADPDGLRAGVPAIVMSRVPGRIHLTPSDPESWLRQMAALLPRIHELSIEGSPFESWFDASQLAPPPGARDVAVWRRAIDFVSTAPPAYVPHFIHRDYQHFNLLWTRERLSGVVDWCFASNGPADADVAHCRLNLTVLFSASWAERFRLAYEAVAGRSLDPWWDIAGLMSYSQEWKKFIPLQVGNRMHVDIGGMDARMDDILEFALQRTA
jgi:aminoglycoside phosphotransferase (APT) family kinase protein